MAKLTEGKRKKNTFDPKSHQKNQINTTVKNKNLKKWV